MDFFSTFCATMIALLFGLFLVFGGYRFFLLLLPIWGFFFGFGLGASSMTYLFGEAFFATITSWVVGFVVAVVFAVLSYLFYFIAVGVVAASLGYGLGLALMGLFGLNSGFLPWLVGVLLAIALVVVTYRFNLQKYVIIIATTVLGASAIVATFLIGVNGIAGQTPLEITRSLENPIGYLFANHWFYALIWLGLVVAGIVMQIRVNNSYTIAEYNRWDEYAA